MGTTFFKVGTNYPYQGTQEPILMAGRIILGFEIFAEHLNMAKKGTAVEAPVNMDELIVAEEEPEGGAATLEEKVADDRDKEPDLETFVLNSIIDIFYDDYDVSIAELFETDDLFTSKVNAMNAGFAYLCDVLPNGYTVCDDHFMHLFDINSTPTASFNLGTIDNPKDILLVSDLTHDEREKMIEILKKR